MADYFLQGSGAFDPNDPKTWGGLAGGTGEYKPADSNEAMMMDQMRAQGGGAQLQQPAAQPGWSDPFATQQAASNNPATLDERGQMVQQAPYFSGLFGTKYQGSANDLGFLAQYGIDPSKAGWNTAGHNAAPTYDLNTEEGRNSLNSQQSAAGLGARIQGMRAFIPDFQARYDQGSLEKEPLVRAGMAFGVDPSGYDLNSQAGLKSYADQVAAQGNQYELISGLSGGWGGTGNAREAYSSLYKNENGKLVPVGDSTLYTAPEKGGWLAEHPAARVGIYGAALVATLGAAGVGAGAAGAASGGGSGGAAAASGSGMAGGAGGGISGYAGGYGSLAGEGYLGTAGTGSLGYGSLGATGAAGGGSTLAGSLGAWGGAGLFAPGGITSTMAGLYSQGGSPLVEKAKEQLIKKARSELIKRALGGGQGGGGMGGGLGGGSGTNGQAGSGMSGGWKSVVPALDAAYLKQSYAPIVAEENRKRLAKRLKDEQDEA